MDANITQNPKLDLYTADGNSSIKNGLLAAAGWHMPGIPSTWEVEAGELGVQGHCQFHSEAEACLSLKIK